MIRTGVDLATELAECRRLGRAAREDEATRRTDSRRRAAQNETKETPDVR